MNKAHIQCLFIFYKKGNICKHTYIYIAYMLPVMHVENESCTCSHGCISFIGYLFYLIQIKGYIYTYTVSVMFDTLIFNLQIENTKEDLSKNEK